MTAHEKKCCPICKATLPDVFSYVLGVRAYTAGCPSCSTLLRVAPPDFTPVVAYAVQDQPK